MITSGMMTFATDIASHLPSEVERKPRSIVQSCHPHSYNSSLACTTYDRKKLRIRFRGGNCLIEQYRAKKQWDCSISCRRGNNNNQRNFCQNAPFRRWNIPKKEYYFMCYRSDFWFKLKPHFILRHVCQNYTFTKNLLFSLLINARIQCRCWGFLW